MKHILKEELNKDNIKYISYIYKQFLETQKEDIKNVEYKVKFDKINIFIDIMIILSFGFYSFFIFTFQHIWTSYFILFSTLLFIFVLISHCYIFSKRKQIVKGLKDIEQETISDLKELEQIYQEMKDEEDIIQ